MNADNSDILRRSLFQLGDWHIVKSTFSEGMLNGCFAIHTNCAPTTWDVRVQTIDNVCFRCGDMVPDELQGMLVLLYWET